MGLKGKIEVEMEIKCNSDILYELFSTRPHNIADMSPVHVHGCQVHEGEFGKPGSVISWDYTLDGKRCSAKELIETIDEENKLVRCKIIEGDLLAEFKEVIGGIQVIPTEDISRVKLTVEFEKMNDDIDGHYPTKAMDLFLEAIKDVEAHHLNASA